MVKSVIAGCWKEPLGEQAADQSKLLRTLSARLRILDTIKDTVERGFWGLNYAAHSVFAKILPV